MFLHTTQKYCGTGKPTQINSTSSDSARLFKTKGDASLSYHMMCSLFYLLVFIIAGSSSDTVVTYTNKTFEEMQCLLDENTVTATWNDDTTANALYTYSILSPADIHMRDLQPKHGNFRYSYLENTHFNLIIDNVEREDEGTYSCESIGDQASDTVYHITVQAPPTCALEISFDKECKGATLSCSCSAIPTDGESPSDSGIVFSYFNGTGDLIEGNAIDPVQINDVEAGVELTYSCRGCNGLYYGDCSYVTESKVCTIICNYTGLIAACIVEAIIIVVLILVIIYLIARDRLGYGKKTEHRSTNQIAELKGTENRAYMDLQELEDNTNEKNKNLEVPEKNVKLVSLLPGKGMMQYHRALVMRAAGNLEAVVRTLSGDSTLRMNELQSSEVQHILKLPGDNSIMKLLGWCDTVPNYLICEYLSGGNLSDHLTEEFSPQKVHQYGNTKQKRFQVAEKGNAEHLPKYALQVARGLKFLTKHRFVSPGLRSKKVLLDAAGRCKLYDFVSMENAKQWTKLFWNENVPFQWMPPEFLFLETISPAGDVWSFGVLLWEIFSYGSEPYKGQTRADVEKSLRAKRQLLLPENCPGAIWQVMITCWEPAVEERLKIDDVTYKLAAMCHEDKEYQEIG